MKKQLFAKRTAIVLALALLLTSFASVVPVNAASTPDMKKVNVKWDLKNNKTLKFKTKWNTLGARTVKVKMTDYKVKKAKKKGYKQCTFKLTFTQDINPTKKQRNKMNAFAYSEGEYISPGGGFWVAAVDYKTGKCLVKGNKQKVKSDFSDWNFSDWEKIKSTDGFWFEYAKKATIDVKIIYPKNYKNLVIGVGGYSVAPHFESKTFSGGGTSWLVDPYKKQKPFLKGKQAFSESTVSWSKSNKNYAHFRRVK